MSTLPLIFLVLALVFFGIASFSVRVGIFHFGWAGLFCYVLSVLPIFK